MCPVPSMKNIEQSKERLKERLVWKNWNGILKDWKNEIFVIVVPSHAIRKGVLKNLEMTHCLIHVSKTAIDKIKNPLDDFLIERATEW